MLTVTEVKKLISALQGSLTPELSLSYIFPYIYSTNAYYYGEDVLEEYSYTELYTYVGITALVLFGIFILHGKKDRFFYYIYSLLVAFLILGYLRYIPFIHLENLPVLSSFRYWTRSIFLFDFSLALGGAFVLQNVNFTKVTISKKSVLLLVPILYLVLLTLVNTSNPMHQSVLASLINCKLNVLQKKDILIWAALPLCVSFLILVRSKTTKTYIISVATSILVLVIVFDYRYYAADVLNLRIKNWSRESELTFPVYYNYHRIIDESMHVRGMKPLLRLAYTPYGYTQFVDKGYWEFFNKYSLGKSPKTSYANDFIRNELKASILKNFGISYIRAGKTKFAVRNAQQPYFLKDDAASEVFESSEGNITVKVVNNSDSIYTTLKNDSNWTVKVNGKYIKPDIWESVFMKIPAPSGENILELRYIPKDFYLGVVLGVLVIIATMHLIKKANLDSIN